MSDSRSACSWSASERIVRNLKHANGSPPIPGRIERYSTGPREVTNTAIAIASSTGLSTSDQQQRADEVERCA